MDTLFLDVASSNAPTAVNVHPVVLFSILDQHLRRAEGQDRVIGAWMRRGGAAAKVRLNDCLG
jgi:hypothetical protein